jgi:hypothetical protein
LSSGEPVLLEQATVEEHAHGLYGIERNTLGGVEDLPAEIVREPGDEPVEELFHRRIGQRIEREGR